MVSLAVAVAYNLQCSTLVVEKILGMKNGRAQWSIVLSYKGWQKVVPLKVFTRFFSVVNVGSVFTEAQPGSTLTALCFETAH